MMHHPYFNITPVEAAKFGMEIAIDGDMSLIGPRPQSPQQYAYLSQGGRTTPGASMRAQG